MVLSLLLSTFLTVFIAELGDKTQLATLTISGTSNKPLAVFLGSSSALVLASLFGALTGGSISSFLPEVFLKLIASITFLIIGIHADKSKDSKDSTGWTCESDGFWYQNGKKTDYSNCGGDNKDGSSSSNKDKKSEACTESTNPGMPSSFPKTLKTNS